MKTVTIRMTRSTMLKCLIAYPDFCGQCWRLLFLLKPRRQRRRRHNRLWGWRCSHRRSQSGYILDDAWTIILQIFDFDCGYCPPLCPPLFRRNIETKCVKPQVLFLPLFLSSLQKPNSSLEVKITSKFIIEKRNNLCFEFLPRKLCKNRLLQPVSASSLSRRQCC